MTDELPPRPHAHRGRRPHRPHRPRRPRRRGRRLARISLLPITVAAASVAGSALGVPVPGVDRALDVASPQTVREAPALEQAPPTAAPTRVPVPTAPAPAGQSLGPGRTLSAAPTPTTPPRPRTGASATVEDGPTGSPSPEAIQAQTVATRTAETASRSADRSAVTFRVASFNMLGASHTGPGSQRPRYATGATRAPWAVRLLEGSGVSVAGLQEFQPPQIRVFNRVADGWRAWPGLGSRAGVNSLVWRTGTWQPVETHTLAIPYFGGRDVPMPYVLLRNVATGRQVWFANFHNPADAHGPAQRWRDEAVRREVALVNRLNAGGTPVVVTGDFNDREAFFCPLAHGAGVTSADGSHLTGGGCDLAPKAGVDWIVGTRPDLAFTGFHRLRGPLVNRTSDHPFVWSVATAR